MFLFTLEVFKILFTPSLLGFPFFTSSTVTIYLKNGNKIVEERGVADAHPSGKRPFRRSNYIDKFSMLTDGLISQKESRRFLSLVQNLKYLKAKDMLGLNVEVMSKIHKKNPKKITIF